jgi:hypothetical protein
MIVVVLILVILILSVILAFQFGKKSTSQVVVSKPLERKGEEDTSSTANAQPIETEPPEEEDPGTCELTSGWAMTDQCNADGTAIFTRTYKESKPGACPSHEKADIRPCCYQKGDWTDTSGCNERGRKTQKQTTVNCAENFKTREVDCPYVGPWRKTGGCASDGKQYYVRDVINSTESKEKTENCCYISPWSGWSGWGGCNGSKRYRNRTRTVVNCPSGTSNSETGSQNCNHCAGYWSSKACKKDKKHVHNKVYWKKVTWDKYTRTKNASNGGNNSCPSNGATKNRSEVLASNSKVKNVPGC